MGDAGGLLIGEMDVDDKFYDGTRHQIGHEDRLPRAWPPAPIADLMHAQRTARDPADNGPRLGVRTLDAVRVEAPLPPFPPNTVIRAKACVGPGAAARAKPWREMFAPPPAGTPIAPLDPATVGPFRLRAPVPGPWQDAVLAIHREFSAGLERLADAAEAASADPSCIFCYDRGGAGVACWKCGKVGAPEPRKEQR